MATENDSFIREVNEDIRQENIGRLWRRLKPFVLGGAVALILAVIAIQSYSFYMRSKAQRLGDAYAEALKLAEAADYDKAFAALADIENSGFGGYPMLAEMRKAALLAQKSDNAAAVTVYDHLAADNANPQPWRDAARIRAAYLLADSGSFADVERRVKALANDVNPMRQAAREALGLSAWKAGRLQEASYYFNRIVTDNEGAGTGFSVRALMMISLIGSESDNGNNSSSSAAAPESSGAALLHKSGNEENAQSQTENRAGAAAAMPAADDGDHADRLGETAAISNNIKDSGSVSSSKQGK